MSNPLSPASHPIVAITMGDPTGIGPEIIVQALQHPAVANVCKPVVLGRPATMKRALHLYGLKWEVREIAHLHEAIFLPRTLECLVCGSPEADAATAAQVDARGGQAAYDCLLAGTQMALNGECCALVTAPLHKAALHAAGHNWPGHTELLAHLCGVEQFAMMLFLPPSVNTRAISRGGPAGLGVVHVTLHMALRDVFQHLSIESVLEKIELAHSAFFRMRAALDLPPSPALAVAALNPHAGESGLFGDEEFRIIAPAVEIARSRGWNVQGPLPVDTLMPRAAAGEYDAVVAMYHDQGHIALKLLDMFDAVNVTLGLPIIRTSVAHGTAHDLAWQGKAKGSGMVQAIVTAARLARSASDRLVLAD